MSATFIILITLMGFGSLTFLIFGTHAWTYHNFHWATASLFKIMPDPMDFTYLPAWNTWTSLHLTMPIISGIITLALLILRYLIFSIILMSYDALRFQTGIEKDVHRFLKDRTIKRYFEIESSKSDLRMFEKSNLDSQRYQIILRLLKNAVNIEDNEARQQAMGNLLLYNLIKKAELKNFKSSETEMTNQLKNDFLMINSLRAALRLQRF
ncbi:uncharacterized protein LOC112494305 [Cephus cinctus]|uniref:Uncharacterized protein LOC112494305 n=1 Tax=Cephus cinctus TaxID=211228 RepID=A0AAJ7RHC8_CEPCN|nr:uncharacterized protein LOC112494305 [Cephus cinctus]